MYTANRKAKLLCFYVTQKYIFFKGHLQHQNYLEKQQLKSVWNLQLVDIPTVAFFKHESLAQKKLPTFKNAPYCQLFGVLKSK